MPLTAVRHVRKMRGGAQAHLLEADDGCWYVVKFRNNPQHPRILVNEQLSSVLLGYLKIAAPPTSLIHVSTEFLAANPEIHVTLGTRMLPVEPGWHFGSRYPGDPARVAVYDFLPDALLPQVVNLADFRAILVFDKWVGNADGRQSIFYRARCAERARRRIQARVRGQHDRPWLRLQRSALGASRFPAARPLRAPPGVRIRALARRFPAMAPAGGEFPRRGDRPGLETNSRRLAGRREEALERLLERLFERRKRVRTLIEACREARSSPFPNWR